jgi:RNA polymerase sigma-70 factor (ECF subfamily)
MDPRSVSEAFWAAAPSERWPESVRAELNEAVVAAIARAAAAWPALVVPAESFAGFVGARMPDTDDPLAALATLRMEELFLCCACLAGLPAAITELEKSFVGEAGRALGRLGLGAHERDEALQHARAKLLAGGPDGQPKLSQFSGQGSLAGWIRVVIVRSALNARRTERRHAPRDDDLLAQRIAGDADDPELAVVKARYGQSLAEAVAAAFRKLTSEQRNLLRMYVIDGLTLNDLGRMHAVDASTISRWLARIRGNLLAEARNQLLARHALRPSECDSVMRVVQGDLFVTVERLLRTEPSDSAEG